MIERHELPQDHVSHRFSCGHFFRSSRRIAAIDSRFVNAMKPFFSFTKRSRRAAPGGRVLQGHQRAAWREP